jgi:Copper binding proteins, plastocyanin/azurin family
MKQKKVVAFAALALAAGAVATGFGVVGARSDDGRQLNGVYCSNPNAMPKPGACIQLSFADQTAQGYTDSPNRALALRPGVYWLTVDDNSSAHNYVLESPDGTDQALTGVTDTPGAVTYKVNLKHGTWVLFCAPHRAMGMYVDMNVGGVGQVG